METKKYYKCEPTNNGSYRIKEKMLFNAGRNCFEKKEDAVNHFVNAERVALDKYNKILIGINKLKKEVGDFSYDCEVTADDSGLETTMYIEFYVDGYCFKYNQ